MLWRWRAGSRGLNHGGNLCDYCVHLHRTVCWCCLSRWRNWWRLVAADYWYDDLLQCDRSAILCLESVAGIIGQATSAGAWMSSLSMPVVSSKLPALKFLVIADVHWGWGLFNRGTVLGMWLVAAVLLAYIAGGHCDFMVVGATAQSRSLDHWWHIYDPGPRAALWPGWR